MENLSIVNFAISGVAFLSPLIARYLFQGEVENKELKVRSRFIFLSTGVLGVLFFVFSTSYYENFNWLGNLALTLIGVVLFHLIVAHQEELNFSSAGMGCMRGVVGAAIGLAFYSFVVSGHFLGRLGHSFPKDLGESFVLLLYLFVVMFWLARAVYLAAKGSDWSAVPFVALLLFGCLIHGYDAYKNGAVNLFICQIAVLLLVYRLIFINYRRSKDSLEFKNKKQILENYGFIRGSIDSSPIPSALARGDDGKILYLNAHLCMLLGRDEMSLLGQPAMNFVQDTSAKVNLLKELKEKGVVSHYHLSVNYKGGGTRWLTVSVRKVTYLGEECVYISASDITEIKRLQENLLVSQERLMEAEAVARLGHWEFNLESKELRWSKQMFVLADLDPAEFEPSLERCKDLVQENDVEKIIEAFVRVLAGNEPETVEFKLSKNGKVLFFQGKINRIFDEERKRLYGTCLDITREKTVEQEREQMRIQLLRNEKLASIGELSAGVSHEINNPLAVILGCNEVLSRRLDNEFKVDNQILDLLTKQEKSILRIKNIVDHMRVMARSGPVENRVFDMKEVILETVGMFELIYQKEGVWVKTQIQSGDYPIYGDEGRFQQVIMNLLSNARDAVASQIGSEWHQGGISIEAFKEGSLGVLKVKDTGVGIRQDQLDKIFDTFYTTKEVGKGTGLGLGITRGIIYEMDGKISVNSVLGQETTFTVEFPLKDGLSPVQAIPEGFQEISELKSQKVLIVDDEEDLREVLQMIMSDIGFDVMSASNGLEAKNILRNYKVDVLMTDVAMPGMNGKDLLKWVADQAVRPEKMFLISGGLDGHYDTQSFIDGFPFEVGRIDKPFTREDVLRHLIT